MKPKPIFCVTVERNSDLEFSDLPSSPGSTSKLAFKSLENDGLFNKMPWLVMFGILTDGSYIFYLYVYISYKEILNVYSVPSTRLDTSG